jgi:NAD+ diphosphatase
MINISKTHPSNIFSHCPSCGHEGFIFDKKKFSCSACNFIFYINAATAVAAILESLDGRIVLTKRKHDPGSGLYDLPGGFVCIMERAEDALKREVFEELGVSIEGMKFMASFPNEYIYEGISYFTCDLAFVCPVSDLSGLKPADDVAEALLMHPDDIDFSMIAFKSIVNILKYYISSKV